MRKTFKFKLKTYKSVETKLNYWLRLCQLLYNADLELRIKSYKETKKTTKIHLPTYKKEYPEYKQIRSQTLQDVQEKLDLSFENFFRRIKQHKTPGFPRFKSITRYDSFTLKQNSWKLNDKYIEIKNIGKIKIRYSRLIEGVIKTITIKRSCGSWYILFSCDQVPLKPLPKTNKEVALDVGIKDFLTTSEGTKIKNPKFLKQSETKLIICQQRVSRRKKGSNRRNKAKLLLSKSYEHLRNQRSDFQSKLAKQLVTDYDRIYIEKLNNEQMTLKKSDKTLANKQKHNINKSKSDVSWSSFFNKLKFKAEEAGKEVIEVNPSLTSQVCSKCGSKHKIPLSQRTFKCPNCNYIEDRDYNAAFNILRAGQALQAISTSHMGATENQYS